MIKIAENPYKDKGIDEIIKLRLHQYNTGYLTESEFILFSSIDIQSYLDMEEYLKSRGFKLKH